MKATVRFFLVMFSLSLLISPLSALSAPYAEDDVFYDFNDGDMADWNPWGSATWAVENGELVGTVDEANSLSGIWTGSAEWSDYVFSLDSIRDTGGVTNINFRSSDTHGYWLILTSDPGQATLGKFTEVDGSSGVATVDFAHANGELYHIKVVMSAATIVIYINDELTIQYTDEDPITTGNVSLGINTLDLSPEQRVRYDNVSIIHLDEKVYLPVITKRISAPSEVDPLRTLAQKRDFLIGSAAEYGHFPHDDIYSDKLAEQFNWLTPENAMKFEPLRPSPESFDFSSSDALVDFASAHDMQIRGHTLVWHNQLPSWLTEGTWTQEELEAILQEHISTVVGRYRGKIRAWDVVNEAITTDGSLRDTFWLQGLGPDYIKMAFEWAHQADPDALLFYNDYGAEEPGAKSDAIYALVTDLLDDDTPIHGIGLQMHERLGHPPNPNDVVENMNRFAELDLEVHITEMDVRIHDGSGTFEEKLKQQAQVYRDMLSVCLNHTACNAFTMWGYTDKYSWWYESSGGSAPDYPDEAPLILDPTYAPKPAYFELWNELAKFPVNDK